MLRLPFFDELDRARNILVAGAGGGFDVFSGLPLYFALKAAGKKVHLANLTFSSLPFWESGWAERLTSSLMKITADTQEIGSYFPELYLAQWFRSQGMETPVYCFERTGAKPLAEAYRMLAQHLAIDTVVLVDGGTDSLMRGDEVGLGTPQEDISSIVAVNELQVERKLLACLGFGVDYFHGVCHSHFLEAVAELIRNDGYLGMFSVLKEMPEAQQFKAASEFVFARMPNHVSIVTSSILSALAGHFGDHHATPRTRTSELYINPLMPVCWCFRLRAVAERILYYDQVKPTMDFYEVTRVIQVFRETCHIRRGRTLPV